MRSVGFKLQLFLDLSMVALEDWENMVNEIEQIIPPVLTRSQEHPQGHIILSTTSSTTLTHNKSSNVC